MTIDPRLLERRRTVAEENAHRSIGRLLRFLVFALLVGGLVWLALSPWLSVNRVRTTGIASSDANAILAEHGVVAGTPMILLRPGEVERAIAADPWIVDVTVQRDWPDEVLVRVLERKPVIWVQSREGWTWRAIDGEAVPGPSEPDPASPRLVADGLSEPDLEASLLIEGAAEFVDALPEEMAQGMTLRLEEGEIWADVQGFAVRLGRPIEMKAKALTLSALLREQIPEGSTLILVAPTNPAVQVPDASGETAGEDAADTGSGEEGATDG